MKRSGLLCGRSFRWLGITGALLMMVVYCSSKASASTIYVTTTLQKISETGGCSLQEAIFSANFDNNIALTFSLVNGTLITTIIRTQCVPGSGDDTIVLPAAGVLPMGIAVRDPNNPFGPTSTPVIFTNITSEGFGAQLVFIGSQKVRAFTVLGNTTVALPDGIIVTGTGQLTIRNVLIKEFVAKGGDGGQNGGGGGMGAGGAIYNGSIL